MRHFFHSSMQIFWKNCLFFQNNAYLCNVNRWQQQNNKSNLYILWHRENLKQESTWKFLQRSLILSMRFTWIAILTRMSSARCGSRWIRAELQRLLQRGKRQSRRSLTRRLHINFTQGWWTSEIIHLQLQTSMPRKRTSSRGLESISRNGQVGGDAMCSEVQCLWDMTLESSVE